MTISLLLLILGAGGGIGRQLSLEFAVHGAKLVLWDINKGNFLVSACALKLPDAKDD